MLYPNPYAYTTYTITRICILYGSGEMRRYVYKVVGGGLFLLYFEVG